KFAGVLILTAALVCLECASLLLIPVSLLPAGIRGGFGFNTACLTLLCAAGFLCPSVAFGGLRGLFKFRATCDAFTSLAFYGALLYGLWLLARPSATTLRGFFPTAAAAGVCLCFCLLGKLLIAVRVKNSLMLLSEHDTFRAAERLCGEEPAGVLVRGLDLPDPVVCNPQKAVLLTKYIKNAYAAAPFDGTARFLAPFILLAAAAAAVLSWYLSRSVEDAVAMFSIACCIGAPVTGVLSSSLPMWRACGRLRKKGALLTGCGTVAEFSDVNAFVVDIKSIFPEGTVSLSGIKSFAGRAIDDAIVDGASLACAAGGPLGDVLMQVLGSSEMLRSVEGLECIDGRGLCGWVNSHRVLLGSRELMRRFGIETPSHDYEAKVAQAGDEMVYLSVSGELTGMLMLHYNASKGVAHALRRLQRLGVALLVSTTDPNITCTLLAERFKLDIRGIKILDEQERALLQTTAENGRAKAGLAFMDGAAAYACAVTACIKLRGTISVSLIIQVIGCAMGIAFAFYIAFTRTAGDVTVLQLLAFQGIWALPVLLISVFRRH
ncbi:MAG: hypothetical protein P4M02_05095, partial [Clostridia bacterium]|nr:hypothetical protein [Clostridia bacterium]